MEVATIVFFITISLAFLIHMKFTIASSKSSHMHQQILLKHAHKIDFHERNHKKRVAKLNSYDFEKYNLHEALNIQNFE